MDQLIEQDDSTALIEQAKAIVKIADAPGYHTVYNQRGLLKDMIKLRKEKAKPHIDNAQKALDDLTDELAKYVDPMALEYKRLGGLMVDYDDLQEKIKQQREHEQKIAEDKATAAKEAEKAELAKLATELNAPELAEEIEQTPVERPPPVVFTKETPKTEASFAITKKYEVVDLAALVKAVATSKGHILIESKALIDTLKAAFDHLNAMAPENDFTIMQAIFELRDYLIFIQMEAEKSANVPILALTHAAGFLHKQTTALFDACPEIPGKFGPKGEQKRLLYPGVHCWGEKGARQ